MIFKRISQGLHVMFTGESKAEGRVRDLEIALANVLTWADELQPYSDAGTELAPVFKNARKVLFE
jgi:hypothetical protein